MVMALEGSNSLHISSGSLLPGWSKTGRRRTRQGRRKAVMTIPASESDQPNLLPGKRKLVMNSSLPWSSQTNQRSRLLDHGNSKPDQVLAAHDKDNMPMDPMAQRGFICDRCGRSFKSYQALGGHKAHHNNRTHRIGTGDGENDDFPTPSGAGGVGSLIHECPLCNKVFTKGQALGHRRHCKDGVNLKRVENGIKKQECIKTQTGVFSFDLNQLPPESRQA